MPHRGFQQKLDELEQLTYCVGEIDEESYSLAIFGYDLALHTRTGKYFAVTPLFDSLDALFDWARSRGFKYRCVLRPLTIGRVPC